MCSMSKEILWNIWTPHFFQVFTMGLIKITVGNKVSFPILSLISDRGNYHFLLLIYLFTPLGLEEYLR